MPHDALTNEMLLRSEPRHETPPRSSAAQRRVPSDRRRRVAQAIDDPSNWLMGEVSGGPIKGLLGAGQTLPSARDALTLIKRLRDSVSRVPPGYRKLLGDTPMSQSIKDFTHPSAIQAQEQLRQSTPDVFSKMKAMGLFDRK